jgi:aspartyl-tRNA(Asn)/glutamyl-tRNA(Gln) amidotransferase subunit C
MAKLTREDVLKLAKLAKLELTSEEIDRLGRDLPSILEYVEQLSGVDTTGLEPTLQVTGLQNVKRPDEVIDYGYKPADLLKNLPSELGGQIRTKRIL